MKKIVLSENFKDDIKDIIAQYLLFPCALSLIDIIFYTLIYIVTNSNLFINHTLIYIVTNSDLFINLLAKYLLSVCFYSSMLLATKILELGTRIIKTKKLKHCTLKESIRETLACSDMFFAFGCREEPSWILCLIIIIARIIYLFSQFCKTLHHISDYIQLG